MNQIELIKELRAQTNAGMKSCKDALEESQWDLQKAIDIIKIKGLNIADNRAGIIAADGLIAIATSPDYLTKIMVEVNCQTDFVAKGSEFTQFTNEVAETMLDRVVSNSIFKVEDVEGKRKDIVASTKENVVVRRFWAEQSLTPTVKVFSYLHANSKIGVLLSLQAPNEQVVSSQEFIDLGNDLVMQIAAMNPLVVSEDRLSPEVLDRQKNIFETQLKEEGKPELMWPKIMIGKLNKWYKEACLLDQESIVVPKSSVKQVISNVSSKLGGPITAVNFIRAMVGEGVVQKKSDLAEEVAKLMAPIE